MRCNNSALRSMLTVGLCGLLLTGASSVVAESAAMGRAATIAPGDCWSPGISSLEEALARCIRLGTEGVELLVSLADNDILQACGPHGVCAPLAQVLRKVPPTLLLRTSTALLDEVQNILALSPKSAQVLVVPEHQRPTGNVEQSLAAGVTYHRIVRTQPRPMVIHLVEASLARGDVDFVVTPGLSAAGKEFVAQKTTTFARDQHLLVATNGGYFRPFNGGKLLAKPYVPAPGQAVEVDGLSIADGHEDSTWENPDPRSDGTFCFGMEGVSILHDRCPPGTVQGIGAGPVLLLAGERQPLAGEPGAQVRIVPRGVASIAADELAGYYGEPQPRTAIGLDRRAQTLWFVVVDGRQPGYSEGITLAELTDLFMELGANSAINLDGGGSSSMALGTPGGGAALANSPVHTGIPGRERPVANHIGLRLKDDRQ